MAVDLLWQHVDVVYGQAISWRVSWYIDYDLLCGNLMDSTWLLTHLFSWLTDTYALFLLVVLWLFEISLHIQAPLNKSCLAIPHLVNASLNHFTPLILRCLFYVPFLPLAYWFWRQTSVLHCDMGYASASFISTLSSGLPTRRRVRVWRPAKSLGFCISSTILKGMFTTKA